MRPRERRDSGQNDLFKARLDQIVDLDHPLAKLGRAIDWRFLEERFGAVYSDKAGHPPLPTRLMAGLSILKHMHAIAASFNRCFGSRPLSCRAIRRPTVTGRPPHTTDAVSPTTNTPGTFSRAGAPGKPGAVEPERCSRSRNTFEQHQAYVLAGIMQRRDVSASVGGAFW
jgi:hypothetical protein